MLMQKVQSAQIVGQHVQPVQVVAQEEVQLVQVVAQDEPLQLVEHQEVQPKPPEQGLPRRSNRSVRRRFENLCEENLSNFSMQM